MDSYWTPAIQMLPARRKGLGTTLRKAWVPYFRIYDVRFIHATRPSAGWVADDSSRCCGRAEALEPGAAESAIHRSGLRRGKCKSCA